MFESSLGGLDIFLFAARALVLLSAFGALGWALMRMRRESAEHLERIQHAQRDLVAQTHALSERVAALSVLVAAMPRRPEPAAEPAPPPRVTTPRRDNGPPSYETAKRMARSGASVEEIVATCGMAGTEARLLRRLHGADSQRHHAA
jgi:hypothetical protein